MSGPYDAQTQTTPPVVGATVNLIPATDENANPVKVATTTADGSYSMTAVPPGQYKVRVAANDPLLGAPRWYGGATFAEAAIVTITPGTHLLWVYVFFDAITASISGTVNGPLFGDGCLRRNGGGRPGGRRERRPGGDRDHCRGRDLRDPGHSAG